MNACEKPVDGRRAVLMDATQCPQGLFVKNFTRSTTSPKYKGFRGIAHEHPHSPPQKSPSGLSREFDESQELKNLGAANSSKFPCPACAYAPHKIRANEYSHHPFRAKIDVAHRPSRKNSDFFDRIFSCQPGITFAQTSLP